MCIRDRDKISKDKSVVLLDVRTVGEFNRGHMDGFKNIPVDELRERINEIEKGKPVYLICQSGLRRDVYKRQIGDLAGAEPSILETYLGKMGLVLHTFANGWDKTCLLYTSRCV